MKSAFARKFWTCVCTVDFAYGYLSLSSYLLKLVFFNNFVFCCAQTTLPCRFWMKSTTRKASALLPSLETAGFRVLINGFSIYLIHFNINSRSSVPEYSKFNCKYFVFLLSQTVRVLNYFPTIWYYFEHLQGFVPNNNQTVSKLHIFCYWTNISIALYTTDVTDIYFKNI